MPAPTIETFKTALTQAYLSQGFSKKVVDPISGNLINAVPPALPEAKAKEVMAQATALSQVWMAWQLSQVVTVPVTGVPGTPSTGILP